MIDLVWYSFEVVRSTKPHRDVRNNAAIRKPVVFPREQRRYREVLRMPWGMHVAMKGMEMWRP